MFLVECPGGRRTREVLEKIIVEHVEPGTTIFTDCWAAYNHLEDLGILRIFAGYQNHFANLIFAATISLC